MPLTVTLGQRGPDAKHPKDFADLFVTVRGDAQDYERLARYHYCHGRILPAEYIFKLIARSPHRCKLPDPVGVVVYRYPIPQMPGRNQATNNYFRKPNTNTGRMKLVNRNIRYAARIIIDPRFRKIGLAKKLQQESLDQMTIPIVETLCPVDWTSNLLRYSNYTPYYCRPPKRYARLKNKLRLAGVSERVLSLPAIVNERLHFLSPSHKAEIEKEIKRFMEHWPKRYDMPDSLSRTRFFLDKLNYPPVYWIWRNPKYKLLP